jgi:hypothetical protein
MVNGHTRSLTEQTVSAWYLSHFGSYSFSEIELCLLDYKSRDSSVGIALSYGLDDRGSRVQFPAGAGNFSLHHRVRTALGPTQPPIRWVLGALSLWVKRPGREADHSSPSSAEVKE